MRKGYEIPISTTKIDEALKKVEELHQKLRNVGSARVDGGYVARGGTRVSSDPWSRLNDANDRYSRMRATGLSDDDLRATRLEQARAQRSVDRANKELNPVQADPIKTMFMRTRLRVGPWQPLVGDLVKNGLLDESKIDSMMTRIGSNSKAGATVARLAGAAMPLLIGASVATVGGGMLLSLGKGGMDVAHSMAGATFAGGGLRNSGASFGIGRFAGMNPDQTASLANDIGDKLRSGGFGAGVMRSMGVVDLGRATLNKFDNLIKVMDALRKLPEAKAIMVGRDLGLPGDLMRQLDLSDKDYERLKRMTPDLTRTQRQQEASFGASATGLGSAWDRFKLRFAGPFGNMANGYASLLDGDMRGARESLGRGMVGSNPLVAALNELFGWQSPFDTTGEEGSRKKPGNATKELNESIKTLTRTMKDGVESIGGGPRARNAIPAGWKHQMMDEGIQSQMQTLGCFTIA